MTSQNSSITEPQSAKLRRLRMELAHLCQGARHDRPCPSVIATAVEHIGVDPAPLDQRWEPEGKGSKLVKLNEWLTLRIEWTKLETGRFEVNAYVV